VNFHKQIEISLKQMMKDLELDLQNCRKKIENLENEIESKEISIEKLNLEKQKIWKENKKLELEIVELKNQLKDSDFEISNLNNLLKQSKENHKIFQYVLGKFSPELANKLKDIQLVEYQNEMMEEKRIK
jgi:chromosome segregation ATPase